MGRKAMKLPPGVKWHRLNGNDQEMHSYDN